MGYLVNSLNWCGNDDQTDFDYEDCRAWDYDDCYGQATSVFWNKASALVCIVFCYVNDTLTNKRKQIQNRSRN